MSSDHLMSSVLKTGGYSSNATNASMFFYNSSLEYTIYSNTSLGNNATSDHTVIHAYNMPVWSQVILYSVFLFFVRFAIRTPSPEARFHPVRQRREREARLAELRKDPDVRGRAIEQGLITKRIVSCDDKSTLILGDLDGSVSDDVHSIHSTDPYASTCSICLEAFQISDTVTWSRADVCRHVFHTDCIHEWFSNPKHEDCPSCRAQIIDLDQPDETSDRDNNDAGILYMVMDGLVSTVSNQASWITGEGDFTEPSRLQITFRRVSSDIYSHLSQNLDLDDDDESVEGLAEPVPFRRTMSEGLRPRALSDGLCPSVNSRGSSSGMHALSRSLSTSSASASTIQDEESQHSEALQCRQALRRTLSDGGPSPDRRRDEVSRPGLFATRAFRRSPSAGLYAKVSGTFEEDDDVDELGSVGNSWGGNDEDSLRLQEGPTLESNDEEDLESGQRLC